MAMTRREFVAAGAAVGAALGGGVVLPVGLAWERDRSGSVIAVVARFPGVVITDQGSLVEGEPVWFSYPSEGQANMLVKMGWPVDHGAGPDRDIVAFSTHCTHMGCPIQEFSPATGTLGPCSCHFTTFDLGKDGIPAFGQATQHLPRVLLRLDGDGVVAVGLRRPIYGHSDPLHGVAVRVLEST